MIHDHKNYDELNGKYVGSEYGDMRRERMQLMRKLFFTNDVTLKTSIAQITQRMYEYIKARNK